MAKAVKNTVLTQFVQVVRSKKIAAKSAERMLVRTLDGAVFPPAGAVIRLGRDYSSRVPGAPVMFDGPTVTILLANYEAADEAEMLKVIDQMKASGWREL